MKSGWNDGGWQSSARTLAWAIAIALVTLIEASPVRAQTFTSGSNGSDGPFAVSGPPGTIVVFDPSQFSGTNVSANVFNFTTITIPAGVTVQLKSTKLNGPVHWLATGDVNIAGTLDLQGANGAGFSGNSFTRASAAPPPGRAATPVEWAVTWFSRPRMVQALAAARRVCLVN